MLVELATELRRVLPPPLVDQLVETYEEVKRNYYLGRLRPSEVEGGRFAEAVFRILEYKITGTYTPIGSPIANFEKRCEDWRNVSKDREPEAVRLHIPRSIRLVYDIRSKRDAVHLADGIDPNLQDASFVVACCDWVMAELVRLFHEVDANAAYRLVSELVTRKAPVVQEFGDFLKTQNPSLGPSDRVLVLLYHRGTTGATTPELESWLKPSQRSNLGRVLRALEGEKDLIVGRDNRYKITALGMAMVENRRLFDLHSTE